MNGDMFVQQVEQTYHRWAELYRGARASLQPEPGLVLPIAFKELGIASEELQVAAEELSQQTQQLETRQSQLEVERQRYQNLFESLSDACLVTNKQGIIQEANRAAVTLLNVEPSNWLGKLLINFIPVQERRA